MEAGLILLIIIAVFSFTQIPAVKEWLVEHGSWTFAWPGLDVVTEDGEPVGAGGRRVADVTRERLTSWVDRLRRAVWTPSAPASPPRKSTDSPTTTWSTCRAPCPPR